jgi:hypothetical protein
VAKSVLVVLFFYCLRFGLLPILAGSKQANYPTIATFMTRFVIAKHLILHRLLFIAARSIPLTFGGIFGRFGDWLGFVGGK